MSELSDLEAAVVALLQDVTLDTGPAFSAARGFADPDRRRALAALARESLPAAFVLYTGRPRGGVRADGVAGPHLSVLIANGDLGGEDRVRLGADDRAGSFRLLEGTMRALDGAVVLADRRLMAVDEQVLAADDRFVVYEQRYRVDRLPALSAPTFDGQALAGSDGRVIETVGPVGTESVSFAFPGVDGVFRHALGRRGRTIRWDGTLVGVTEAALRSFEDGFDAYVGRPAPRTLVDSAGREYPECVLDSYEAVSARRRHPVSGQWLQDFRALFTQLRPAG